MYNRVQPLRQWMDTDPRKGEPPTRFSELYAS